MNQKALNWNSSSKLRTFPCIGFVQGILLWLSITNANNATEMSLLATLLFIAAFFLPTLWFLTAQVNINVKTRIIGTSLITLVIASTLFFNINNEPSHLYFAILFALVSIHLLIGWRTDDQTGWDYQKIFSITWRNFILTIISALFTLICYGTLTLGAILLKMIGVEILAELLKNKLIISILICTLSASAFALGLKREKTLINMRHFILTITYWVLIIVQISSIFWIIALSFTGLQPIFASLSAASVLLSFIFLSVLFINSAHQNGCIREPFGKNMSYLIQTTWHFLLIILGLASCALWLRVAQYSWTTSRIYASLTCFIATAYVVGYSLSTIKNTNIWMHSIPKTNIIASLTILFYCVGLINPWSTTIATNAQLYEFISQKAFNFSLLTKNEVDLQQLKMLSNKKETPRVEEISELAEQRPSNMTSKITEKNLRDHIKVLPAHAIVDPSFLAFINHSKDWHFNGCFIKEKHSCIMWINDFNNDHKADVMIIEKNDPLYYLGSVYSKKRNTWQEEGIVQRVMQSYNHSKAGAKTTYFAHPVENNNVKKGPSETE